MIVYRNVAFAMAAAILLQLAAGALWIALPLAMSEFGWSRVSIGIVFAAYSAGFMGGAFFAPHVIRRVGHIRAFAGYAGCAAAVTLMLALGSDFAWWMLSRFGFGICIAGLFAVSESWIADATPPARRGAVLSMYQIAGRAGLIAGPFLVALPGLDLTDGFIIAGICLALCLTPVVLTSRVQPQLPDTAVVSPLRLLDISPAAAAAVFAAGMVNTGLLAFLPIWAETLSGASSVKAAAIVVGVVYSCSILTQWPAGHVSDRFDRRIVIAVLAACAALAALALAVIPSPDLVGGAVLAGLWGAASLAYYAVAVAHAVDRSRTEELPAIASGLLMVWAAGSMLGPILAGLAYSGPLQERGLFLFAAVVSLMLTAAMLLRSRQRAAVTKAAREPFLYLSATSSELAEIDRPHPDEPPADRDAAP
jgi:MFS family permease